MVDESWRMIPNYEGRYQVSDHGRVRSLLTYHRSRKEIIMRDLPHYKGYRMIFLRDSKQVKTKHFIHRLVAHSFLYNHDSLPVVNHKDGNKKNNAIHNLEWVTFSENTKHYYSMATDEAF